MNRFRTILSALLCAGILVTSAHASSESSASNAARLRPWLGTWICRAGNDARTMTFSPILNGSAMRVTESGRMPIEETVTFDAKRQKWINQHVQASGAYATFEGTQSANAIEFSQVYPTAGPTLTVTTKSKTRFTTAYAATVNGKRQTYTELCTKA